MMDMRGESLKTWMDEWVYGCPNRQAYIDHYIAAYGAGKLDASKLNRIFRHRPIMAPRLHPAGIITNKNVQWV